MELEPIDPETALELYLTEKETAVADATGYSPESRLDTCPHCTTGITAVDVLIEYETSDGPVWTDCPGCREVVNPA